MEETTLWVMAAGIAASAVQFLVFVARTYGLPSSALTPQTLFAMFGLVLVCVGAADIIRYFVVAGIRVEGSVQRRSRQLMTAVQPDPSVPDQVLAQRT